ncbi:hypothetical protein [Nocardia sp. NPDC052566]|uniref:hypothetical protein n=1 Tax=Nocardia sp. NPDC052566 TaxID=3364330 RepID=UPI0037CB48B9
MTTSTSTARNWAGIAAFFAACGLFYLAATNNSLIPVFLIYTAAAAYLTGDLLRNYETNATFMSVTWLCAVVAALFAHYGRGGVFSIVSAILLISVAVLFAVTATLHTVESACQRRDMLVSSCFAWAIGACVLWPLLRGAGLITLVPLLAAALLLGLGFVAALFGGVISAFEETTGTELARRRFERPRPVPWHGPEMPDAPRAPGGFAGIERAVAIFVVQLARACVLIGAFLIDGAVAAGYLIINGAIAIAIEIAEFTIYIATYLWAIAVHTARTLARSLTIAARAVRKAARGFLFITVTVVGAVGCEYAAAAHTRAYLHAGAIADIVEVFALMGLLVMAISATVWLASALPIVAVTASIGRTLTNLMPWLLLGLAAGGWLVGAPGTFWHGPIRIGWVTGTSTALLVIGLIAFRFYHAHRTRPSVDGKPVLNG